MLRWLTESSEFDATPALVAGPSRHEGAWATHLPQGTHTMTKLPPLQFTILNPGTQRFAPVPSSMPRAKIPGGWLVYGTASNDVPLLVFVPDAEHQWDGGSLA